MRVTAQLIEAGGGSHLWSRTFEKEMTGIFALQDEIARAVVEALKVKLLRGRGPGSAGPRRAGRHGISTCAAKPCGFRD